MGTGFRWLLGSSWTSNIGDGIAVAAAPLLVASQTRSPVLVALAALLQRLPWLVVGLWGGALADRLDRRVVVMVADALRALVVAALSVTILTGTVSIALVLVTMTLYGVAEVFADTTTSTLLPMLVDRGDLGIGNARLQAGFLTMNQLIGPPVGALLFAAGMVWPFLVQVFCVALSVLIVARIATPKGAVRDTSGTGVWRDITQGFRWTWRHPAVRTLALVILAFNVTWGAAWSVLVLYSLDHLHLGEVGFGLLATAVAVGGLAATVSYDWLERRVALATLMRVCLLLEVLTHLALALTTVGWLAILIMVVFGAYAFVWGTLSQAVRQRAVPQEFQGRVASAYCRPVTSTPPPRAPREPSSRTVHGDTVVDDYAWMSDRDDPRLTAYLEAENAYTAARTAHVEPLATQIFEEIRARTKETDLSVPVRHDGWWYYGRTVEGLQYGIAGRVDATTRRTRPVLPENGPPEGEQVVLDENIEAEGHEFFSLGASDVSPDGSRLAFAVDVTGDEQYDLRIRDLATGADLDVAVTGIG